MNISLIEIGEQISSKQFGTTLLASHWVQVIVALPGFDLIPWKDTTSTRTFSVEEVTRVQVEPSLANIDTESFEYAIDGILLNTLLTTEKNDCV